MYKKKLIILTPYYELIRKVDVNNCELTLIKFRH